VASVSSVAWPCRAVSRTQNFLLFDMRLFAARRRTGRGRAAVAIRRLRGRLPSTSASPALGTPASDLDRVAAIRHLDQVGRVCLAMSAWLVVQRHAQMTLQM